MGIFSKITKGFKKIVKGIGKGIKKVAKGIGKVLGKIAKPFQKFGILGQLALGFIMPWAVGSIFSGLGSLASTGFGNFATGLTQSSNLFAKAAGYVFKGVHWGATRAQTAYSKITTTISDSMNWVGDKFKAAKNWAGEKMDAFGEWVKGSVEADPLNMEKSIADAAVQQTTEIDELFAEDLFEYTGKDSVNIAPQKTVKGLQEQIVAKAGEGSFTRTGAKLIEKGTSLAKGFPESLASQAATLEQQQPIIIESDGRAKPWGRFVQNTGEVPMEEIMMPTSNMLNNQGYYWNNPGSTFQVQNQMFDDPWEMYMNQSLMSTEPQRSF